MKSWHNIIKYAAIALAIILIIGIISGIMHLFSFLISTFTSNVTDDYELYEIKNEIYILDIDIHGIDFEVKKAPDSNFKIETNYRYLTINEKENKLLIKDKKSFYLNLHGRAMIRLYVPENKIFDKVKISTGTGRTDLEKLQAKFLDMQFGAGEVILQNLSASDDVLIEGGVGKLTIKDSSFNNLKLNMGVGQLEFSGILLGENSLQMGVGSSQINLSGSLEDYTLNIDKGLGNIYVDNNNLENNTQLGQGDSEVFFEGGIGSVRINFSEQ